MGLCSVLGEGFPTRGGCCANAMRKKKKKEIEPDGSEGTGQFIRFGGPIVGSTGQILAQPPYGPIGRTGPKW